MSTDDRASTIEVFKYIDSAVFNGSFYGILNAQGDFWTPLAFDSEESARGHMEAFWRNQPDQLAQCLRTHRIVPVRIQLSTIQDPQP